MTSTAVAIAESPEHSEPECVSTPLRSTDNESEPSGFCTSCGVLGSGSDDTERGRQSYNAGMRRGLAGYINSPLMEQLSLELTVTRAAIEAMSGVAAQREVLILHWKAEASWWREESQRISAEYTAFVAEMARRFAR